MNSINIKITKLDLKLKVKVKLEITCGMKVKIILSAEQLFAQNNKQKSCDCRLKKVSGLFSTSNKLMEKRETKNKHIKGVPASGR